MNPSHDMGEYISALTSLCEQAGEANTSPTPSSQPDLTPLLDRVRDLVKTLPPDICETGIPLEYVRERLKGRRGNTAHAGSVAGCLRRLGWTRTRAWRQQENGFRALWYPPPRPPGQ